MSRNRRNGVVGEAVVAFVEDRLGIVDKAQVALDVGRVAGADLFDHVIAVADIVEAIAIAPDETVERRDRQQLDVVGHVAAGEREEFFQALGAVMTVGPASKMKPSSR
jgi:hypothetical protein